MYLIASENVSAVFGIGKALQSRLLRLPRIAPVSHFLLDLTPTQTVGSLARLAFLRKFSQAYSYKLRKVVLWR